MWGDYLHIKYIYNRTRINCIQTFLVHFEIYRIRSLEEFWDFLKLCLYLMWIYGHMWDFFKQILIFSNCVKYFNVDLGQYVGKSHANKIYI